MYGVEQKKNLLRMFVVSLLLGLATCTQAREASVQAWVTTGDKTKLLARGPDMFFRVGTPLRFNIDIDADTRYQEMVGFGAAITDASAWLIQNRMSPTQRLALMQEMFGAAPGIGLNFTRLTIGASEYSRHHYSFDDMPPGENDPTLAHFSIDANRADVLPVVKMALAINPQLRVMATPWSAPGWMKTSDSLVQGSLRPEFYGAFADYLLRYVDAYAAEGVPIYALTLQNEPHFEPADYPGMRLDPAARSRVIGEFLGPRLAQRSSPVRVLDWDHNWNEPEAPLNVLADPVARSYVAGVAWHCYKGEVTAQTVVHDAYPDKETYFTECASGEWETNWGEGLTWVARNLIVGSTRAWAKGVLFWNLALDENHGPHLGGCPYCRGVVTIDSATGAVTRNSEYYAFAHASRFVHPGARRIKSSAETSGLSNVAFRNGDDGSLVLIVANSSAGVRRFSVRYAKRTFSYKLDGKSIATFVWRPKH